MIWAASKRITPKHGDTRTRVIRPLLKRVNDSWVFLSQIEQLWVYEARQVLAVIEGKQKVFEIGEWVKVTEIVVKWQRL